MVIFQIWILKEVIAKIKYLPGHPEFITLDRDIKFLSHFLRELYKKMNTNLRYSSTCHPQIDGQTEMIDRTLGIVMRDFAGYKPKQ